MAPERLMPGLQDRAVWTERRGPVQAPGLTRYFKMQCVDLLLIKKPASPVVPTQDRCDEDYSQVISR